MSQLKETIRADLKTSMKAKEKERTGAIRALLAAIQAEETTGARHEITDEDVLKVIAREIKKRRESAQMYICDNYWKILVPFCFCVRVNFHEN